MILSQTPANLPWQKENRLSHDQAGWGLHDILI